MFDHVEFPVASVAKSGDFYAAALGALGIEAVFQEVSAAGFGKGEVTGLLIFQGDIGPRRLHICFSAGSKEHVAQAHAAALGAGGTDNGAPGYRTHYALGYYAAFVLDPDGNNVEFLYRDPVAK